MTRMGGYSSGGIICMNERGGIQTVSRGERGSLVLDVRVAERSERGVAVDEDTGGVLEVGVVGDGLESVEEGDHLVQEGLLLLDRATGTELQRSSESTPHANTQQQHVPR